jgi:Carboxypeptidase regulatory-like domain
MFRAVFVFAFVIALSSPGFAQTGSTGAIAGTVRDQTGAMVPEAQVTARNVATNEVRQVTTQANGAFVFPLLPPGEFVLEVTMGGFTPARREGVRVNVTETTNISIDLLVEGITDTVQVSGATEIVVDGTDGRPTAQALEVYDLLVPKLANLLASLEKALEDLARVNDFLATAKQPPIVPSTDEIQ